MKAWPKLRRAAKIAILSFVTLVALLALSVPVQQRLLRYRAERLLSDMKALELRKSNWQDAQKLMTRWGAWGHYDGSCTAAKCEYKIELTDTLTVIVRKLYPASQSLSWLFNLAPYAGGRFTQVNASFTVWDGRVWGKSYAVVTEVPRSSYSATAFAGHEYGQVTSASSVSHFHLGANLYGEDYTFGRPGGGRRLPCWLRQFHTLR